MHVSSDGRGGGGDGGERQAPSIERWLRSSCRARTGVRPVDRPMTTDQTSWWSLTPFVLVIAASRTPTCTIMVANGTSCGQSAAGCHAGRYWTPSVDSEHQLPTCMVNWWYPKPWSSPWTTTQLVRHDAVTICMRYVRCYIASFVTSPNEASVGEIGLILWIASGLKHDFIDAAGDKYYTFNPLPVYIHIMWDIERTSVFIAPVGQSISVCERIPTFRPFSFLSLIQLFFSSRLLVFVTCCAL